VAIVMVWVTYAIWPRRPPPKPPAPEGPVHASPELRAFLSVAVLMPLMLAYMLFGWADVMAVLVGTMILVVNFDRHSGRMNAIGRILGNFLGGLLGMLLFIVLLTTPTLPFLALLLFPVLLAFGRYIMAGGARGQIGVIACNAMLIVLSSSISTGPGPLSLWLTRLFQFSLAGAFAVGMMYVVWHFAVTRRSSPGRSAARSRVS
jgi:hypothetical protein